MDKISFEKNLADIVRKYISNENGYGDNAQLQINTSDLQLEIVGADADLEQCDYYSIMDLVRGSSENPGQWEPDIEAISEVVAEYIKS